jgi:phospho-N-acetylmuramoyl-pentapeptide-transferase
MTINNFAIFLSIAIVLVMGPAFLPFLQRLKFGQIIREEGPKSHMQKQGTPTMGGLMFIIAIAVAAMAARLYIQPWIYPIIGMLMFGLIGFADDYIKVVLKRNLGLRAYQKFGFQTIAALVFAYLIADYGQHILVPFTEMTINLGLWYYPFVFVLMTAITNSVNLTDGLDGLASGVSIITMIFFVAVGIWKSSENLLTLSFIVIFALLGFLYYNRYPAKVFMGDTGSLAIGGLIGGMALITGTPLYLIIIGGVYVIETLSVILQVASFKMTGKRIFKMAPLHHHFELKGWSEKKVVWSFYMTGLVFLVVGILSYKG